MNNKCIPNHRFISKGLCLLISLLMAISTYTVAYAADTNVGLTPTPSYLDDGSEIQPFTWEYPYLGWNLATEGSYSLSGSADHSLLYTNYYFTGVNSMDITIRNRGSESVTVKVYKMGSLDVLRSMVIIGAEKSKTWNVGTKKDANYYICFSAPCTVSGTVSNGG